MWCPLFVQCLTRLKALIPGGVNSLVGREAAEAGCVKLHEFLQAELLVRSLAYTLVDLLLLRMFPDMHVHGVKWRSRHR